jgi:hypothetical protein
VLPSFKRDKADARSVYDFLQEFEIILEANQVGKDRWRLALCTCVPTEVMSFIRDQTAEDWEWSRVKEVFMEKFQSSCELHQYNLQFMNIKLVADETVAMFSLRYLHARKMAGRESLDDPYHFYATMPQLVQDRLEERGYDVKMARAMRGNDTAMTLTEMIAIAGSWDSTLRERYGPYDVVAKRYKRSGYPNASQSNSKLESGRESIIGRAPQKHGIKGKEGMAKGKRLKYPCQVAVKDGDPCGLDHTNGEHWRLMRAGKLKIKANVVEVVSDCDGENYDDDDPAINALDLDDSFNYYGFECPSITYHVNALELVQHPHLEHAFSDDSLHDTCQHPHAVEQVDALDLFSCVLYWFKVPLVQDDYLDIFADVLQLFDDPCTQWMNAKIIQKQQRLENLVWAWKIFLWDPLAACEVLRLLSLCTRSWMAKQYCVLCKLQSPAPDRNRKLCQGCKVMTQGSGQLKTTRLRAKRAQKLMSVECNSLDQGKTCTRRSTSIEQHKLIFLPIQYGDEELIMLLDGGSNASLIHEHARARLNIPMRPLNVTGRGASKGSSFQMTGFVECIELSYGTRTNTFALHVMEGHYDYDGIIGIDQMHKLGLGYTGLVGSMAGETDMSKFQMAPVQDKPLIASGGTNLLAEEMSDAISALDSEFDANGKLRPQNACSHPASVIRLEGKDGSIEPIWRTQYPLPKAAEQAVDATVEGWIKKGYVVDADPGSPWNFPLTVAAKKDLLGNKVDVRVCLDSRALNAKLKEFKYPVPRIMQMYEQVAGHEFYSSIDLRDAYMQWALHPDDQDKLVFTHGKRRLRSVRAMFGLAPMTSYYQHGMDLILADCASFALSYIDDIVVFSHSLTDHIVHLQKVLRLLTKIGLRVNKAKCQLFRSSMILLGFMISKEGSWPETRKLECLWDWPQPCSGKEIQRFLGFVNYFRRYVPLMAKLAAPLDRLRHERNLTGKWGTEEQKSFDQLRAAIYNAPMLCFPDFEKLFFVATDASNYGIGAVLFQKAGNGSIQYVRFASRALSKGERNYSATKKELLGIVYALESFRDYIWGQKFTLYTDHRALVFMFIQKHLNRMLCSWLDELLEFSFEVVHLPGVENVIPDILSRISIPDEWKHTNKHIRVSTVEVYQLEFAEPHEPGTEVQIEGGEDSIEQLDKLMNELSDEQRYALIQSQHDMGHFGARNVVAQLKALDIVFPGMTVMAERVVNSCKVCAQYNPGRTKFHPQSSIEARLPMEHIGLDLTAKLGTTMDGFNLVLVIVCVFSKFVILRPLRNKSAVEVGKALYKVCCDMGFPKIIQCDNGSEFRNELITELCKTCHIQQRFSTPYHPQGNGLTENAVKLAKMTTYKTCRGDVLAWKERLPATQYALNVRMHTALGFTPFTLMFGRNAALFQNFDASTSRPISKQAFLKRLKHLTDLVYPAVAAKSVKMHAKQHLYYDQLHTIGEFPVGTVVMMVDPNRVRKEEPKFVGPYTIMRKVRGGAYILMDTNGKLLDRNVAPTQLKAIDMDSSMFPTDHLEIKGIKDVRGEQGNKEYLVQWKDAHEDDSWVHISEFDDLDIVQRFHRQRGAGSGGNVM